MITLYLRYRGEYILNFTAIDFETANEQRSSACAIGIVCIEDGIITGQEYHLIKPPGLYFNHFNTAIHGISRADVVDKPNFAELWPAISHYFEDHIVIAHNASFDLSVLRAVLDYYKIPYPHFSYGCTLMMSRRQWPEMSHRLNDVAAMLDIEFHHHHALEDANACARIATHILDQNHSCTIEELSATLDLSMGSLYPGGFKPSKTHRRKKG